MNPTRSRAYRWACCALLAALVAASARAQAYRGRLGVEAVGDAFVDIARQPYRWEKPDSKGGWVPLNAADVDERGWPRCDSRWIADFRPCAEWAGQIDDPDAYRVDRSGTYHGAFRGSARLIRQEGPFIISNSVYDAVANQTTFDLTVPKPGPQHGLIILEFRESKRAPDAPTGCGLTDFRLIRPGYTLETPDAFTTSYRRCLTSAAFSTIRFMGVLDTNGNVEWDRDGPLTQSWAHRKLLTDAAVGRMPALNKKDGWPWELVIELCNATGMDAWINIPVAVDDAYIRELALLLKRSLRPELNIYLEHSNEIWNFGFLQYAWNKARAAQEAKAGQTHYNFDGVDNDEIWAQRRHAQRVKDAVDIFADVFGRQAINHRVRGILAGVTAKPNSHFVCGRLPGMLDYLEQTSGSPSNWLYAISIPLYYGGKAAAGEPGTQAFSVGQVIDDMRATIDSSKAGRAAVIALAGRYHLPGGVCAYEGGPDIGGGKTTNLGNRIGAIRDPRQAELYRQNLVDAYWELGGNLAMQFALASPYTRHGAWGLTDDVNVPDRNSLFPMVRELIGVRGLIAPID